METRYNRTSFAHAVKLQYDDEDRSEFIMNHLDELPFICSPNDGLGQFIAELLGLIKNENIKRNLVITLGHHLEKPEDVNAVAEQLQAITRKGFYSHQETLWDTQTKQNAAARNLGRMFDELNRQQGILNEEAADQPAPPSNFSPA